MQEQSNVLQWQAPAHRPAAVWETREAARDLPRLRARQVPRRVEGKAEQHGHSSR